MSTKPPTTTVYLLPNEGVHELSARQMAVLFSFIGVDVIINMKSVIRSLLAQCTRYKALHLYLDKLEQLIEDELNLSSFFVVACTGSVFFVFFFCKWRLRTSLRSYDPLSCATARSITIIDAPNGSGPLINIAIKFSNQRENSHVTR